MLVTRSLIDDGTGSLRFCNSLSPRSARRVSRFFCSIESATVPNCLSTAGASRRASRIAFTRDSMSSAVCTAPETARYRRATFRWNSSCAARSAGLMEDAPSATTLNDWGPESSVTASFTFWNIRTE